MAWLGMNQSELTIATGLSRETVRPYMQGRPTSGRPTTTAKISRALRRPPDAIQRILAGEDPNRFDTESEPDPTPPRGAAGRRIWDPEDPDDQMPDDWPVHVGRMLAGLRELRGLGPGDVPGVSRATVERLEAGIRKGTKPELINAYLQALEAIPEAIDHLGAGAPLEAVMLEHQEPDVQIAALAGRLDPDAQREAMDFVRDLLKRTGP
jgi:transcriptional regulator with XRE-family HTH domain